ncbi:vesicle-associated protein 4-1-like [Camellia sinensis]|uniref:vesicle-associated protein 4-1-like n=1 Tax=Camellia sinensis TaxID=4442 RepID=UPI001036A1E7|nr:vesicle-associated protein 4-1-like [Camellia sinensis]
MAIADDDHHHHKARSDGTLWWLCQFWKSGIASSSSSSSIQNSIHQNGGVASNPRSSSSNTVFSAARSLLPTRRRLRLDPAKNLYFPCSDFSFQLGTLPYVWEPWSKVVNPIPDKVVYDRIPWNSSFLLVFSGMNETHQNKARFAPKQKWTLRALFFFWYDELGKQVRSAVRIKNTSRSHVAFKFQTTAPKSCYMRPPGGILAPGESLIATVFKFMEHPEKNEKQIDQTSKVKFKIMSLKVKKGMDYVSELFDERKDQVTVEQVLHAVFLDVEQSSPALEKLKRQLAEAEAAQEEHKKPLADTGPRVVGEGLVIDEWKERREKYLARQQVEAVDSV